MRFSTVHPVLESIAAKISARVSEDFRQDVLFDALAIHIGADASKIKLNAQSFTVERRADTPFSENVYFSAAPVATSMHLSLLEEFENAIGF